MNIPEDTIREALKVVLGMITLSNLIYANLDFNWVRVLLIGLCFSPVMQM